MTEHQMRGLLEAEIGKRASLRALAREWKISHAYISDVRRGEQMPGPAILKRLGLRAVRRRITTYEPLQRSA